MILYPGVMAGRFQHFSRVGEILDSRFDWGVAPHTTRKGLGLLGHVWIFSVCCKVGSTRASERLHLIRTSALPKGTNPSKRDEKNYKRRIDWPPSTAAPTALSLAWPPHQTRSFFHLLLLETPSHSIPLPPLRKTITNRKHVDTERPVLRQEEDGHRRRPLQGSCRRPSPDALACRPDRSLPSRGPEVLKFSQYTITMDGFD